MEQAQQLLEEGEYESSANLFRQALKEHCQNDDSSSYSKIQHQLCQALEEARLVGPTLS